MWCVVLVSSDRNVLNTMRHKVGSFLTRGVCVFDYGLSCLFCFSKVGTKDNAVMWINIHTDVLSCYLTLSSALGGEGTTTEQFVKFLDNINSIRNFRKDNLAGSKVCYHWRELQQCILKKLAWADGIMSIIK